MFSSSLPGVEGRFVCVWNCLIFSNAYTYLFDLKLVAFRTKLSQDSYLEFQEKNYFGEIFQNFCANQGYPIPKLLKFGNTFCNFIPGPFCVEKVHISAFICCLHPGKETRPHTNHKKKIRWRKARTFCFRITSFVRSQSGTYYALLFGYRVMKFLPDICHCVIWFLG